MTSAVISPSDFHCSPKSVRGSERGPSSEKEVASAAKAPVRTMELHTLRSGGTSDAIFMDGLWIHSLQAAPHCGNQPADGNS